MFLFPLKKCVLLAVLMLLSACSAPIMQKKTDIDIAIIQSAKIINTHTGKWVTSDELLYDLVNQNRIVIGEKHDNRYHHDIEYWLMTQLPQKRPQGAVLLEMLTPNQQSLVNKTKQRYSESQYLRDERLMAALQWNKGWPWKAYHQIVKAGLAAEYPLLSANLDREEIALAYQSSPVIDGTYSTAPDVRQLIKETINISHGNALNKMQSEKMTVIQQLRDRRMAQNLLEAPTPAMLIAGSFHASKVMGIPLHIKDLAPHEKITVVIMAEEGSDITPEHADYLWITPVDSSSR